MEHFKDTFAQIAEGMDLSYFKAMIEKLEMSYPTVSDIEAECEDLVRPVNPVWVKNNPVSISTDVLKEMYGRLII